MNRLQEYLKTPNPVNPEFFFPLTCRQEDVNDDLFSENLASNTKQMDSPCSEQIQRWPIMKFEDQKAPLIPECSQYKSNMIYQRIKFQQESEEHVETPLQKKQQIVNAVTTAQKKYELRTNLQNSVKMSDGKQSQRSLRVLTSEAYEVVCQKGSTTYKTVSQEIINQTCDLLSSRQQNNIKRRVYDALNVLIALGRLQKKGRKISLSDNCQKQRQMKDRILILQNKKLQKQKVIKQKMGIYKKCVQNEQKMKRLIERNDMVCQIKGNVINMPFIGIKCENKEIGIKNNGNNIMFEIGNNKNKIYKDLDLLNFIKL